MAAKRAPKLRKAPTPAQFVALNEARYKGLRLNGAQTNEILAQVGSLTFEPVDEDTFACLRLARAAALAGGTAPCVLNAANEVAVHAFLGGRLGFLGIPAVIEGALERLPAARVRAFESLYEADREARAVAAELVEAESERLLH